MQSNRFDRDAYRKRSAESRERARQHRVMKARNRFIMWIVIVFFVALAIFAVVRWALPSSEGAIDLPAVSPVPSTAPDSSASPSPSASASASATPVPITKTDSSYQSENLQITIEKKVLENVDGDKKTDYYVADIVCKDMSLFKTAFSGDGDSIPRNSYEDPVTISERYSALLSINCDNAGYLTDGIIVRNGTLYRFKPSDRDLCMIFSDGTMKCVKENTIKSKDEIASLIANDGLLHTFSFGPALITDGVAKGDYSDSQVQTFNPRSAIGMVEPGHFKLVIVDGRTDENRGVRLIQLEQIFKDLGCTEAYNFDGGQSSIMIYDGKIQNDIAGRDTPRSLSDILYFAESTQ